MKRKKKLDAADLFSEHLADEPFLLVGAAPGKDEESTFDITDLSELLVDEEFSIFFDDLTKEAQERYLRWRGTSEEDENFEISPLAILCKESEV